MARHNLQKLCMAAAVIILLPLWSFTGRMPPRLSPVPAPQPGFCRLQARIETGQESEDPTFYDDNTTIYTINEPVAEWDQKRIRWFQLHPTFSPSENRVLVVTGSQPSRCSSPLGDHFLLRFLKNKVDYCRIHGYGIFYSNAFFHPKIRSDKANMPAIRAAMAAHPQAEWLFWVDSAAVFTDMDFELPLERYKDYNLVVNGWPVDETTAAVNAGVFLIRNCGWSMEFLDVWAGMGPKTPNYRKWGEIMRSTFKEMIYVENQHVVHGYSHGADVGRFDEMERRQVRRRHAEAAEEGGWRRPFLTDFTGCRPCGGGRNAAYDGEEDCAVGMERALNFADNQVLRNFGFVHPDLADGSIITPLPSHHYRRARFDRLY